jgi:type III secretion system TyeA family effector delivery regulator
MQSAKTGETPQAIIREVLPLKNQRRIDPSSFLKMMDRLGVVESEVKIYFLRELSAILRQLPLKVYASPDDRLRLINGLQEALDEVIEEEEDAQT